MLATQMPDTPPEAKDVKKVKPQSVSNMNACCYPILSLFSIITVVSLSAVSHEGHVMLT